mmetsp:Transcript_18779/g.58256  ORF Transcript_18779/g.58256 Transcript_18779/m.58256 type:complete len:285 (+) Transcript_18779:72-926(+)
MENSPRCRRPTRALRCRGPRPSAAPTVTPALSPSWPRNCCRQASLSPPLRRPRAARRISLQVLPPCSRRKRRRRIRTRLRPRTRGGERRPRSTCGRSGSRCSRCCTANCRGGTAAAGAPASSPSSKRSPRASSTCRTRPASPRAEARLPCSPPPGTRTGGRPIRPRRTLPQAAGRRRRRRARILRKRCRLADPCRQTARRGYPRTDRGDNHQRRRTTALARLRTSCVPRRVTSRESGCASSGACSCATRRSVRPSTPWARCSLKSRTPPTPSSPRKISSTPSKR